MQKAAAAFLAAMIVVEVMDRSFLAVSIIEAVLYFLTLFTGYKYGVATGAVMGGCVRAGADCQDGEPGAAGHILRDRCAGRHLQRAGKSGGSSIGFAAAAVGIGAVYAPEFLSGQAPEMVTAFCCFLFFPKGLTRVEQVKKNSST